MHWINLFVYKNSYDATFHSSTLLLMMSVLDGTQWIGSDFKIVNAQFCLSAFLNEHFASNAHCVTYLYSPMSTFLVCFIHCPIWFLIP